LILNFLLSYVHFIMTFHNLGYCIFLSCAIVCNLYRFVIFDDQTECTVLDFRCESSGVAHVQSPSLMCLGICFPNFLRSLAVVVVKNVDSAEMKPKILVASIVLSIAEYILILSIMFNLLTGLVFKPVIRILKIAGVLTLLISVLSSSSFRGVVKTYGLVEYVPDYYSFEHVTDMFPGWNIMQTTFGLVFDECIRSFRSDANLTSLVSQLVATSSARSTVLHEVGGFAKEILDQAYSSHENSAVVGSCISVSSVLAWIITRCLDSSFRSCPLRLSRALRTRTKMSKQLITICSRCVIKLFRHRH